VSWSNAAIGDVVRVARSGVSPEEIESGTTYVGLEHIDGSGEFVNVGSVEAGELASSKFRFTREHVLFGKLRPYLKKTARPNFEGVCSTDILPLEPTSRIDRNYLFHVLRRQSFVDEVSSLCAGANLPRISPKVLAEMQIPVPPLADQRRIAAILDKADALRAKRREAIAKLDQLLQSVFLDMFGDVSTNPKGWPVRLLGEVLQSAKVFTDGDWVESKDQDPNGSVRLIQLADVGDGSYIDKSRRFLTKDTALRLRCTFLEVGDVLVARMPDPLGRACLFPGDQRESVTVVDVCVIRPGHGGPSPMWLAACINSDSVRSQIAKMATGTTRSRISRGNLSKIKLICPPLNDQLAFAKAVERIAATRRSCVRSLSSTEHLFESIQQRSFSGTV
jgi:type I restriction enzyme S subunit